MRLGPSRRRVVLNVLVFEVLVEKEDCALVAAAVAVVGRGEDGDDVAVMAPCVSLHCQLVGTRDQLQPVVVIELPRQAARRQGDLEVGC